MTQRVVIMGGGGFGTFARDLVEFCGCEPYGILDNRLPKGAKVNGCPVLGPVDLIDDGDLRANCEFVAAIQDFALRRSWSERVLARGGRLARLVHPSVALSPSATLGRGVMVNAFSFIYANASVGDYVIVESHSMVGTEVSVGTATMMAPGALINRQAKIGADCFLGSGSVIIPNVTVGDHCLIGAGATVVRNIPENKVAAGTPARVLRDNAPGPDR